MNLIDDLLKGMVALSILAVTQYGCSVKDMANTAADAHKKGLTKYGAYSRTLTGHKDSWTKNKN